jgi:TRAF3-interacting protein 1
MNQVQKEVDKLRGSIQTLTRSANPLGKIMDYVQEDLDSMQKELERWKVENKQHQMDLKREKGYVFWVWMNVDQDLFSLSVS